MSRSTITSARTLALALSAAFVVLAACDASDPASPSEVSTSLNAPMARMDVCHLTPTGEFRKIAVPEAQLERHMSHGDVLVGAGELDLDCLPVPPCTLEIEAGSVTICDVFSPEPNTLHVQGRNLLDMQYLELHYRTASGTLVVATSLKNIHGCAAENIPNNPQATITWTDDLVTVTDPILGDKAIEQAHVSWGGSGEHYTCFYTNPWVTIQFPAVQVAAQ